MIDTRTQLMLDLQRLEQEQYQLREGEQLSYPGNHSCKQQEFFALPVSQKGKR